MEETAEQIESAIAALEAQRALLGDAVVAVAVAPLQEKLAARRYREALARHQQNWQDACRQVGAVFVALIAEDVLARWDLDALVAAEVLRVR